jgi:hypothetical protein
MLRDAGDLMDLIRIANFASDLLVTKLCSGDTIEKLLCTDTPHDGSTMSSLCLVLMFTRINIFAVVNTNAFNAERRVELIWASTIFHDKHDLNQSNHQAELCVSGDFPDLSYMPI